MTWYPVAGPTLRLAWNIQLVDAANSVMYAAVVDATDLGILSSTRLTSPGLYNPQRFAPVAPVAPLPAPAPPLAPSGMASEPRAAAPRADASLADASLAESIALRVYTSDSPRPLSPGYNSPTSTQPPEVLRTLVTLTSLDATASPDGWIDSNRETRGNNVDAHLDLNADNIADTPRPLGSGSAPVTFDFELDLSQQPSTYRSAAVTNLFYWCNVVHDRLYQLGFTETAGNFQNNNFGRGGVGNDALQADAQDGSGTNNANFSTPEDGTAPRMQMYVFTSPNPDRDSSLDATVVIHEYVHGLTHRLVGAGVSGSLDALQSGGLGEGWSDFYALALLSEPADAPGGTQSVGAYITQNYFRGIRRYPYAIEPGPVVNAESLNPLTFSDISVNSQVHDQGEVWCQSLWECRGELLAKHGAVAGNQLMLQLVTDGLKLTPANPSFIQARDAILQADLVATGGTNTPELWRAFTKRGLGRGANAGSSNEVRGVAESFENSDVFQVSNAAGLFAAGSSGYPNTFTGASTTFVVSNPGSSALSWSVTNSRTWLTVTPSSGTLAAGGTVNVTAALLPSAITAGASALTDGTWRDTLAFTDSTHAITVLRPAVVQVGPNYVITSEDAVWNDASTHTVIPLSDDGQSFRLLEFNFPFYGVQSSQFSIGANGFIGLGSPFSSGVAAALGQDLDPTEGGSVRYANQGTAPNRTATITWAGVPPYGQPTLPMTFQIVLYEATGDLLMNYAEVQPQNLTYGAGRQALIGVRNVSNTVQAGYSEYGSALLSNNQTLRYHYTGGNPSPANAAPTVVNGAAISPTPVGGTTALISVLGADDGGEPALTYSWSLAGAPTSLFSVAGNGSNAGKSAAITFTKAGTLPLRATITDAGGRSVTSDLTVVVSQILSTLVISPASATVANGGSVDFTAVGTDQFGTAIAAEPTVIWTVLSGPGTIDANGLFTSPGPGIATIQAAAGVLSTTATITITNAAPTVWTAASTPQSPVTGQTASVSVLGADDLPEVALTYTWSAVGASPAAVAFSPNGTNAAKNATATFTKAGNYSLQVIISDGGGLSVNSNVTVVVDQTLSGLAISPASATIALGGILDFTAVGTDQFGTAIATEPAVTWTVLSGPGTIDANGVFTSPGPGSATIQVAAGMLSTTATITITTNAAPTVVTAAATQQSPVIGQTAAVSVLGADDLSEAALTYTWSAVGASPAAVVFSPNGTNAAKNATATFTEAGTYSLQVIISDGSGLSVNSNVTVVVNQTLSGLAISPASATVANGGILDFTAVGADQFGTAIAAEPAVTWTVLSGPGTIDANGVFTSPGSGSATIQAAADVLSTTAAITITNAAPTVVTAAATQQSPVTGQTVAVSVLGADDLSEAALTYTWSAVGASPAAVTFSPNGTNAAKNATATFTKAGTYSLQVIISDGGGLSVNSNVTVVVNQTLSGLVISPSTTTLVNGTARDFIALSADQFGTTIANQTAVTWTLRSGTGSMTSGGRYTSNGHGNATIMATAGAFNATATITVTNAAPTIAIAAAATPTPVRKGITLVTVLGADDLPEAELTYTWSAVDTPPAAVTFSPNSSHDAKNAYAQFPRSGLYQLQVTVSDGGGATTTSKVAVTVQQAGSEPGGAVDGGGCGMNGIAAFMSALLIAAWRRRHSSA